MEEKIWEDKKEKTKLKFFQNSKSKILKHTSYQEKFTINQLSTKKRKSYDIDNNNLNRNNSNFLEKNKNLSQIRLKQEIVKFLKLELHVSTYTKNKVNQAELNYEEFDSKNSNRISKKIIPLIKNLNGIEFNKLMYFLNIKKLNELNYFLNIYFPEAEEKNYSNLIKFLDSPLVQIECGSIDCGFFSDSLTIVEIACQGLEPDCLKKIFSYYIKYHTDKNYEIPIYCLIFGDKLYIKNEKITLESISKTVLLGSLNILKFMLENEYFKKTDFSYGKIEKNKFLYLQLYKASLYGNVDIFKYLLNYCYEEKIIIYNTILYIIGFNAIKNGFLDIISSLFVYILNHSNSKFKNEFLYIMFSYACEKKFYSINSLFNIYNIPIFLSSNNSSKPSLLLIAYHTENYELFELFCKKINKSMKVRNFITDIYTCIEADIPGYFSRFDEIVENVNEGIDVYDNPIINHIIFESKETNKFNCLKELLKCQDIDISRRNKEKQSVLTLLLNLGHADIIKIIATPLSEFRSNNSFMPSNKNIFNAESYLSEETELSENHLKSSLSTITSSSKKNSELLKKIQNLIPHPKLGRKRESIQASTYLNNQTIHEKISLDKQSIIYDSKLCFVFKGEGRNQKNEDNEKLTEKSSSQSGILFDIETEEEHKLPDVTSEELDETINQTLRNQAISFLENNFSEPFEHFDKSLKNPRRSRVSIQIPPIPPFKPKKFKLANRPDTVKLEGYTELSESIDKSIGITKRLSKFPPIPPYKPERLRGRRVQNNIFSKKGRSCYNSILDSKTKLSESDSSNSSSTLSDSSDKFSKEAQNTTLHSQHLGFFVNSHLSASYSTDSEQSNPSIEKRSSDSEQSSPEPERKFFPHPSS